MRVFAVDPDSAGGWALVTSSGPKPVVLRSGLAGAPTAAEMIALVRECSLLDAVVIEQVPFMRRTGIDTLLRLGYRWETCASLVAGEDRVHRMAAVSWRKAVGMPTKGSKSGPSKAAKALRQMVRDAANTQTLNIDPRKAALRDAKEELYEDSESDAVCMAVTFIAKHGGLEAKEEEL